MPLFYQVRRATGSIEGMDPADLERLEKKLDMLLDGQVAEAEFRAKLLPLLPLAERFAGTNALTWPFTSKKKEK
jgi:hypothetical protein